MANEYERLRLKNIEDNKRILSELGILNPYKPLPRVIKNGRLHGSTGKRKSDVAGGKPVVKKYIVNDGSCQDLIHSSVDRTKSSQRRRSQRLQGKEADDSNELDLSLCDTDENETVGHGAVVSKDRPMIYGHIPGVQVGTTWMMRIEVNRDGIHRPTVAGIHPGPEGAYSIALSGGYEDDIDLGECFTYTGEGGRDLKGTRTNPKNLRTAAQSKDQSLSRGNLALVRSVESGLPVRVLRGYKLHSPYAPDEGYRYDGLYKVEKWWFTTGLSGFGVYKFALRRVDGEAPPPWEYQLDQSIDDTDRGENADSKQHKFESDASANKRTSSPLKDANSQLSNSCIKIEECGQQCRLKDEKLEVLHDKDSIATCDENMNEMNADVTMKN